MEREHEKLKLMIQPRLVTGPKQLSPHRWFPLLPSPLFDNYFGTRVAPQNNRSQMNCPNCGSDNYGLHLIHARSTEPFSAYITRVNGNAGGDYRGIARESKVKFPSLWEGWDVIKSQMRTPRWRGATCSTRVLSVYTRRGLHPASHELVLRIINVA